MYWIHCSNVQAFKHFFFRYDAILDGPYAAAIGEMYSETTIPYTKVTLIHYQNLSKKTLAGRLT